MHLEQDQQHHQSPTQTEMVYNRHTDWRKGYLKTSDIDIVTSCCRYKQEYPNFLTRPSGLDRPEDSESGLNTL